MIRHNSPTIWWITCEFCDASVVAGSEEDLMEKIEHNKWHYTSNEYEGDLPFCGKCYADWRKESPSSPPLPRIADAY